MHISNSSVSDQLRTLLRRAGVYATGDFLTMGLGLILLPLYTAYLTPGDYGILGVSTVMTTIAVIVLPLGLHGAVSKFYFDLDGEQRRRFFGSIWLFLIIVPGVILLLAQLFGQRAIDAFFVKIPYSPFLSLALWTGYVTIVSTALLQNILRASGKAIPITLLHISQFLLTTALTIWFVVGFRSGAEGALWANLLGAGVIGGASAIFLWKHVRLTLDLSLLKRGLSYGLPLIPHLLSFWIMIASDRIILGWYVPLSDVGIYTIGYQIGSALMYFLMAGNNSLMPSFGGLDASNSKKIEELGKIVTYYMLAITTLGLVITLFSPMIIYFLTPAAYHNASIVVPWIVLAFIFMALYTAPLNTITLIIGKTKQIGFYTSGAALLNIVLNMWSIPRFGMIAAAVTTAISYFVLFASAFLYSQKHRPLQFEYRRIATALLSALVAFWIGWNSRFDPTWPGFILIMVALIAYPSMLWVLGFFNTEERGAASQVFAKIRQSVKLSGVKGSS